MTETDFTYNLMRYLNYVREREDTLHTAAKPPTSIAT